MSSINQKNSDNELPEALTREVKHTNLNQSTFPERRQDDLSAVKKALIEETAVQFFNTAGRTVQEFTPIQEGEVGMYTCGPTVYGTPHLGNLRAYIFSDVLRRSLEYRGLAVHQVMNITDVGHLTSDADTGEDKVEAKSKREGKSAWDIARHYEQEFFRDLEKLNVQRPHVICRATEHLTEQIALIQKLQEKGLVYQTSDGLYFDSTKFERYGALALLDRQELKAGARVELGEKRNHRDFALWKYSDPKTQRQMEWDSPWGRGFPGWHLECSAMAMKYLGEQFDIHTGGIDHIPVHHTNEIAQSEAATEKTPFASFWMHVAFLVNSKEEKMGKSTGGAFDLESLEEQNIKPKSFRLLCLHTHYRKQLAFGIDSVIAADRSLKKLQRNISELNAEAGPVEDENTVSDTARKYLKEMVAYISDDLSTSGMVANLHAILRDRSADFTAAQKLMVIREYDQILALDLMSAEAGNRLERIPASVVELAQQREQARQDKNWKEADELRAQIEKAGFSVEDLKAGFELKKL